MNGLIEPELDLDSGVDQVESAWWRFELIADAIDADGVVVSDCPNEFDT